MTKTTKNINARYSYNTGIWAIRDNGEVIAEGKGYPTYLDAVKKVRETAIKKVVEKILWY